jgi:cytochrome c peroxidase
MVQPSSFKSLTPTPLQKRGAILGIGHWKLEIILILGLLPLWGWGGFFLEKYPLVTPPHFGNQYVIPTENPLTKEGVALGRMLFYDTRLSRNNTISCATCHQPEKAFTDGLAVSIGIEGKKHHRSTMSLVNLLWTKQLFWDGRAKSLEEQVLIPLQAENEMDSSLPALIAKLQGIADYPVLFQKAFGQSQITQENIAKALAQFLRTLISGESRYDQIVKGEVKATERELRAINLFFTHPTPEAGLRGGNCGDCHGSHLTTLGTFHDNGLDRSPFDIGLGKITGKLEDVGKMKVPTLRNIVLTAPYMHDGRFGTLREVLDHYNEHIRHSPNLDPLIIQASNETDGESLQLTEQEKEDIIFFLQMLTDSSFVQNPAFRSPFLDKK